MISPEAMTPEFRAWLPRTLDAAMLNVMAKVFKGPDPKPVKGGKKKGKGK